MSKWIIFALLVFVVYLQYTVLEKLKQVPTRKEVYARIEESSSAPAIRQLEERITGVMAAEQEAGSRLRRKVEELEQKLAALTPAPTPALTPAPSATPRKRSISHP